MISKAHIKDIKALHQSKFRQIYNKFIAEGDKVCVEFLKSSKYTIDHIYITAGSESKYTPVLKGKTVDVDIVTEKEMAQISLLKTPSDIFMLLKKKDDDVNILLKKNTAAIYLDGVQDPGNVGTIIRVADWFGIKAVIRSENSADFFNPKVVQATMGSMVNVHLCNATLEELLNFEKTVFGTYMDGLPVYNVKIPEDAILVMGSEGKGISSNNDRWITQKLTIPGSSEKIAESLNVAMATGIICAAWKSKM